MEDVQHADEGTRRLGYQPYRAVPSGTLPISGRPSGALPISGRKSLSRAGVYTAILLLAMLAHVVQARALVVTTAAVTFSSVTLDGTSQLVSGSTSAWRVDANGETGGWNLTVASTEFVTGSRTIAVSNVASRLLDADIVVVSGDTNGPVSTQTAFVSLGGTPLKIASAATGDGNGVYDLTPGLELTNPGRNVHGYLLGYVDGRRSGRPMTAIPRTVRIATPWVFAMLLVFLSVVDGTTGIAHAQEPTEAGSQPGGGFGIRPAQASEGDATSFSYFTHRLEPGDTLVDTALVINEGESQVRLRVFVANAITAVNGGTSFGTPDGSTGGVADWVTLDVDEVLLEPGATQIVRFTIAVPQDARSGDHVAGILVARVATDSNPETMAENGQPQFAVDVVQPVGVAVVIAGGTKSSPTSP